MREADPVPDPGSLDPSPSSGLDRRALLRRGAIVGAAAWVAPQILSIDAAAAATCVSGSVVWGQNQATIDTVNGYVFPGGGTYPFTLPVSGATTVDVDFVPINPTSTSVGYATPIFPLDAAPTASFIEMATSDASPATAPGTICDLTFTFSFPVRYLTFSLLDVDRGQGFWQDRVQLLPTLGGNPLASPNAAFTLHSATIVHAAIAGGDQFTAVIDPSGTGSGAPNNSDIGKIDIAYGVNQVLDRLVIRYQAGPDQGAALRAQQIGVTDLFVCTY